MISLVLVHSNTNSNNYVINNFYTIQHAHATSATSMSTGYSGNILNLVDRHYIDSKEKLISCIETVIIDYLTRTGQASKRNEINKLKKELDKYIISNDEAVIEISKIIKKDKCEKSIFKILNRLNNGDIENIYDVVRQINEVVNA